MGAGSARDGARIDTPRIMTQTTFCPDWATALLNGFSQVLLQRSPLCGLFCLLAITLADPHQLGGALLGAASGLFTAQRRGYDKSRRQAGLYSYNGILIGLLLSHLMPWTALLPLLIIASSGVTTLITEHWLQRCPRPTCLPAYTAPFVLLGWGVYQLAGVPDAAMPQNLPWYHAIATGMGQIFVLDNPGSGALIVIGLWLCNPRAALFALAGCCAGVAFASAQGAGVSGLHGFNPALAALAFSHKAWQALLALTLAIILEPGFTSLALPGLTAPFVLACWLVKAGTRLTHQAAEDCAPLRNTGQSS